ncbi:hypothetical protein COF74_27065 [Bacillus wiedmannii]|nr:hypothetical protein COF74_27065 [Bacillus wiedmannii]
MRMIREQQETKKLLDAAVLFWFYKHVQKCVHLSTHLCFCVHTQLYILI